MDQATSTELTTQDYRANRVLLLSGFTVSTAGDWLYRLALPILVLQLTQSAVSTALTYAIEYIPYLVLSMFAGVVADRFDRRRTLVVADASSAVIMLVLVLLVSVANVKSIGVIYLGAFTLAALRPVYHPALQGLIPQLTPRSRLSQMNAKVQSVESVLAFLGPVLGAGVIALLDPEAALWINAFSFVLSAAALSAIRSQRSRNPRQKIRLLTDVHEGARYLLRDRVILSGSVLMAGTNVGLYLVHANLIYMLTAHNRFSQIVIGIVYGANGLGAVAGAAMAPALGRRWPAGKIITIAMTVASVATIPLALPLGVFGFVFGWGVVGAATMIIVVTWFTLRQQIVPVDLLGRVVAMSRMLAYATIPIASVAGGFVLSARSLGATGLVVISIAAQMIVATLTWMSPLRHASEPGAHRQLTHVAEDDERPLDAQA